ncbi:MAG: SRPBCC family protein [Massilia sp.]
MTTTNESNDVHEIRLVRTYDAPVQAVWDAWTNPAKIAQWWGPRGYSTVSHSQNVRVGGAWRYTMHGPDGVDWPSKITYLEVEPLARLVYDHGGDDANPPLFRVTVLFSEEAGKTRMETTMHLASKEAVEQTRHIIRQAGGESTWDRLGEFIDLSVFGRERFIINRSFDAPLETMFAMWTKPEHFCRWLAPTGMEMRFIRPDIGEGQTSLYVMTGNGMTMYGRAHYEEIRAPDRIVYTQQFCDEHENLSRHPMAPTWPATMRSVVELFAEGPDRTRVKVSWEVVGEASAEEMATFTSSRAGMTMGWRGSFDKLDAYLAEQAVAA